MIIIKAIRIFQKKWKSLRSFKQLIKTFWRDLTKKRQPCNQLIKISTKSIKISELSRVEGRKLTIEGNTAKTIYLRDSDKLLIHQSLYYK